MNPPTPIRLAPRQTVSFAVGRGSVLHVVHGAVSLLASPQWLAETLITGEHPLRQGEHWLFERDGRITLRTDGLRAELTYQAPFTVAATPRHLPRLVTFRRWQRRMVQAGNPDLPAPVTPEIFSKT
ncbi:hypothetical protein [Jeongeupia chitinilytica]|uniref:DUF2917 domain-containing protein n=1 Tax=Jeongeupia chitinilytica TaxID=1041641 RepID=A0ABQ3GV18_9NEIS|nr:hypothetical protein [Jeongeupia chitinilytica]GHD56425.1 hypothetical protein GCM10007350_03550 [Jeongeupia chitinilytica]